MTRTARTHDTTHDTPHIPTRRGTRSRGTVLTVATVLSAGLLLTGCSGSSNDSAASSEGAAAPSADGDLGFADRSGGAAVDEQSGSDGGSGSGAADDASGGTANDPTGTGAIAATTTQQLARRAAIALQVKDIGAAAAKVRSISATSEGIILSENIGSTTEQTTVEPDRVSATTYGEIAISVPSTRLDATLDELAKLGTLVRRDSSSENVGQQIVDTDTRTQTMKASVERIRALMAQTKDLEQVVRLESELSIRTAELESLQAQLTALKGSVARSPITVSLTTDTSIVEEEPASGFLSGLDSGWRAFTGSVVVVLTVLGALLPFLLVLALVGIPLVVWSRRRRPTPLPAPLATPATPVE